MNEQFRQLAEQANTIGDWGEDITEGRYFVYPNIKNLEKFAELILQECIDIISPYTVRMSRPGEEYLHPILEIRKPFGVKQ